MSNITNQRNESLPNYKKKEKGTVFIPKEQEGYVISLLNAMFSSRNNSYQDKSNQGNNSSVCAGTYPVSGYTRSNGVEVSDYMRTCGAAHAGNGENSDKNDSQNNSDNNGNNQNNHTPVFEARIEKNRVIEDFKEFLREHVSTYNHYDNLRVDEALQKAATKYPHGNELFPIKDYYKISLDLADEPDNVVSNNRYSVFKVKNLPIICNEKVILDKIAKGLNLDIKNPKNKERIENVRVIVPRENSKLVELIKNSDEIKNIIKKEEKNIESKLYKNKYYPNGVRFDLSNAGIPLTPHWNDKVTLFGILHNADIYNMQKYSKGEIAFVIVDFYDFTNWSSDKYDITYNKMIKYVNNNAYWQQEAKQLVPYVLYIPIEFSFKEVWDILHPDTPLQELFDKYL